MNLYLKNNILNFNFFKLLKTKCLLLIYITQILYYNMLVELKLLEIILNKF